MGGEGRARSRSCTYPNQARWRAKTTLWGQDYGDYEDVWARAENWTDVPVYRLGAFVELKMNGWRASISGPVESTGCTKSVGSGSPWGRGYNAFWQAIGDHWIWLDPSGQTHFERIEVSKQF